MHGKLSCKSGCSAQFLLLAALLLIPPAADSQLSHGGPAKAIALAASLPPYDVVSVKQNNSGDGSSNMSIHDDTFTATNVPLEMIVKFAYDTREDLISGLSGPVNTAHFDIKAKILAPDAGKPPKLTDSQLLAMVIPLLADRFHLKTHLQPKILPVYDLIIAHGGLKIQLSQAERTDSSWNLNGSDNNKILSAKSVSMEDLATALSDEVHRKVVDRTGLKGAADITLKWTSDEAADADPESVLSIFTAVQEQLGLKLQPSKGPVDTLVIDHVEMPSEN